MAVLSKDAQKNMILNSGYWTILYKLALPAIAAMILYGLNTIFDAIFVGHFVGEKALSGVSLAYPLVQLPLGIGSMLGGGAAALLSIAIGAGDKIKQKRVLGNVHFLAVIIAVIFMVVGLLFSEQMIALMGGKGEALALGNQYFRVTIIGSIFWVMGLAYNLIIRSEGKMGRAAVIMAIGLSVNIAANYIFMAHLKMGVSGAAWGTNLGMAVYTLISIFYFKSDQPSFEANLFSIRRDQDIIKSIISMGIPALIMTVMTIIQGAVILNTISRIGTDYDIAFYGVALRIYTFVLTPLFATMRALQPAVGINFGAKQYDRAIGVTKTFIVGTFLLLLPFWLIVMIAPQTVLTMMFKQAVEPANIMNFRVYMMVIPLLSVSIMSMSFFPAIDKGKTASVIALLRQLVLYVPVMLILPLMFGLKWVYWGSFLIDAVVTLIAIVLMLKQFKELRVLASQ